MGAPKLSLELAPGKKLGGIALRELLACERIDKVYAVLRGDADADWLRQTGMPGTESTAESESRGDKLRTIRLGDSEDGRRDAAAAPELSRSIRSGLTAALRERPEAVMIVLADQPFVRSELFGSLVRELRARPELDYAACGDGGRAMPPALFAPSAYEALGRLEGDSGARKLMNGGRYRGVLLEVGGSRVPFDIDTPPELEEGRLIWERERRDR